MLLLLNPHGSDETRWYKKNKSKELNFLTHTVQMKPPATSSKKDSLEGFLTHTVQMKQRRMIAMTQIQEITS